MQRSSLSYWTTFTRYKHTSQSLFLEEKTFNSANSSLFIVEFPKEIMIFRERLSYLRHCTFAVSYGHPNMRSTTNCLSQESVKLFSAHDVFNFTKMLLLGVTEENLIEPFSFFWIKHTASSIPTVLLFINIVIPMVNPVSLSHHRLHRFNTFLSLLL